MGLQNIVQFGAQLIGHLQKIKMRKSSQFDAQLVLNRPIWTRCYELVAMKHNIIEKGNCREREKKFIFWVINFNSVVISLLFLFYYPIPARWRNTSR